MIVKFFHATVNHGKLLFSLCLLKQRELFTLNTSPSSSCSCCCLARSLIILETSSSLFTFFYRCYFSLHNLQGDHDDSVQIVSYPPSFSKRDAPECEDESRKPFLMLLFHPKLSPTSDEQLFILVYLIFVLFSFPFVPKEKCLCAKDFQLANFFVFPHSQDY